MEHGPLQVMGTRGPVDGEHVLVDDSPRKLVRFRAPTLPYVITDDDVLDHIGYTRFSSGSLTGMAFQNQTKINEKSIKNRTQKER